jgi:hypothetical protein
MAAPVSFIRWLAAVRALGAAMTFIENLRVDRPSEFHLLF